MNVIIRRGDGKRSLVPIYRPASFIDEMEEWARQAWDSWHTFPSYSSLTPHTDMYEEEGQFVMKTELPGVEREDLDITLEGDRLTVKAEKKAEEVEDVTHHTRERYYGQYYRSVTLPFPVKESKISATFENGVLELRIPKAEEAKAKRIKVKTQLPLGERTRQEKKPS